MTRKSKFFAKLNPNGIQAGMIVEHVYVDDIPAAIIYVVELTTERLFKGYVLKGNTYNTYKEIFSKYQLDCFKPYKGELGVMERAALRDGGFYKDNLYHDDE
jgi:hypothetical protein